MECIQHLVKVNLGTRPEQNWFTLDYVRFRSPLSYNSCRLACFLLYLQQWRACLIVCFGCLFLRVLTAEQSKWLIYNISDACCIFHVVAAGKIVVGTVNRNRKNISWLSVGHTLKNNQCAPTVHQSKPTRNVTVGSDGKISQYGK